ncbi:MAG: nucleoside deaminase [Candidatus Altiarchaeota archaeon]|nr:nucleoside deaminase [Candidatus Altiarchaeota archaeon]
MNDEGYMRKALDKAANGIKKGQAPFGACIAKAGKVISVEHNTVLADKDPTAHAEINAIRKAAKKLSSIDLSGCTIYSTCEPCPMCFAACHWAKIKKVVYGASIEDAQKAGFNEFPVHDATLKRIGNSGIEIKSGVLQEQNLELFRLWDAKPGKRTY